MGQIPVNGAMSFMDVEAFYKEVSAAAGDVLDHGYDHIDRLVALCRKRRDLPSRFKNIGEQLGRLEDAAHALAKANANTAAIAMKFEECIARLLQALEIHRDRETAPILAEAQLLAGDVLLYRFQSRDGIAERICQATKCVYTHAAIYLGDGQIAEAVSPDGVIRSNLNQSLIGTSCVAVLRSQVPFDGRKTDDLKNFVQAVIDVGKPFRLRNLIGFEERSKQYFDEQLEFVRANYGKITTPDEFLQQTFFCSAFVVACYALVGVIGPTAQAAYVPEHFSPAHLFEDQALNWLLGFLLPAGGTLPDDEPLCKSMQWQNASAETIWWK